ncbi:recombinase family protein [Streptomyces fodineus]|uniref:recombinase family protein n=1 Tax=Streptomyces fodineus TaxID=1904616 RepID=UPI00202AACEE|nr:recombinase family protein [Streptomyces fodineus]
MRHHPAHPAPRASARSPPPTKPAASPWSPGLKKAPRANPGWPQPRAPLAPLAARHPAPGTHRPGSAERGHPIGYARCSTLGQELVSQLDALSKHGIPRDKIFNEKISTRVRVRPAFEVALRTAREVKAYVPHCRVICTR